MKVSNGVNVGSCAWQRAAGRRVRSAQTPAMSSRHHVEYDGIVSMLAGNKFSVNAHLAGPAWPEYSPDRP